MTTGFPQERRASDPQDGPVILSKSQRCRYDPLGHNRVDPATAWKAAPGPWPGLNPRRSPDMADVSHPTVPERYPGPTRAQRYEAVSALALHLAHDEVRSEDVPAVVYGILRHLAAAAE